MQRGRLLTLLALVLVACGLLLTGGGHAALHHAGDAADADGCDVCQLHSDTPPEPPPTLAPIGAVPACAPLVPTAPSLASVRRAAPPRAPPFRA